MSVPPMNLYVRLSIGPVRQDDVDALLRAMDAPLATGESAQARAEVLQRLVNDPALGALRGRDGRRLDETAAQSLRSMGTSDDTALSERALEPLEPSARVAETDAPAQPSLVAQSPDAPPTWQYVCGVLGMLWGFYEVFAALMFMAKASGQGIFGLIFFLETALTLFLPSYLMLQADSSNSRGFLGVVLLFVLGAIPASVLLSLMCVMLAGSGRVDVIEDIALAFLQAGAVRFILIIPLSVLVGRLGRPRRGTSD